ncbi:MAG: helicase-related protein [Planctomycetota bacterium]|nr:helicase-related protein [Planctomycetota bacterium]
MATISHGMFAQFRSILGGTVKWRLARWASYLPLIEKHGQELLGLQTSDLRKRSLALRYRAKSQESLVKLMPEAFALVREAGHRALNMRHFDVQLLGGVALHHRSIAEMQTGEGKTLTATLALYLESLPGKGAHLATVNDYLAKRDADWMRPLFDMLGVSVGVIQTPMNNNQRRVEYACDVTYGTSKEFGFDFLRDRLLLRQSAAGQIGLLAHMLGQRQDSGGDKPVQRPPHFCLVDEADSVLIDEARTPLIISAMPSAADKAQAELYQWAAAAIHQFLDEEHYKYDPKRQSVELTQKGRRLLRNLPRSSATEQIGMLELYEAIELAVRADRVFIRDRHYVERDGEIVIVDEFTGRLAEGRKWRDGLHQAVEAKEGLEVTVSTGHAARITVQDYFLQYPHLAGMTGTAINSSRELNKIYRLRVIPIPTNRPPIRRQLPTIVHGDMQTKEAAIVQEVVEMRHSGRPVLIGTRSIDKSLELSKLLHEAGILHQVLTAHQVDKEADIVAAAGQAGKVTVSTNMAGRGTDIKLAPGVHELGGLHVICTEMHDSSRIDRQLIGRCGRQGDPGTYRQYLALDDEIILAGLGQSKAIALKKRGQRGARTFASFARLFRKAQRKIEKRHFRDRRILMYHERERKKMQIQMGQDPYLDAPA